MSNYNLIDNNNKQISLLKLISTVFNIDNPHNSPQYSCARTLRSLGQSDLDIIRGVIQFMQNKESK